MNVVLIRAFLLFYSSVGTVPTPQTEAPVVEGQNQERLGATRTYFGTQPQRPTLTPGTATYIYKNLDSAFKYYILDMH